jgi:hypothetical protein
VKVIEICWSRTAISFSGQRAWDPDKKMGKRDKDFFRSWLRPNQVDQLIAG